MPPCNRAPMRLRTLACALGALVLAFTAPAPRAAPEEGTNFSTLVPAQPTSQQRRIEVVEFFSYACPHCARFYPLLNAWVAKLPHDVEDSPERLPRFQSTASSVHSITFPRMT